MFAVEPFDDLGLDVWRWIQAVNVELAKRVGRNRVADLQLPTAGHCFPA
jgi:hypothetical protein